MAGIGASAHTVSLDRVTGERSATAGDEASETRVKAPEPAEQPEAPEAPKVKPPEPPDTDVDNDEQGEHSNEQGEQEGAPKTVVQRPSGEHEGDHRSGTSQTERD